MRDVKCRVLFDDSTVQLFCRAAASVSAGGGLFLEGRSSKSLSRMGLVKDDLACTQLGPGGATVLQPMIFSAKRTMRHSL